MRRRLKTKRDGWKSSKKPVGFSVYINCCPSKVRTSRLVVQNVLTFPFLILTPTGNDEHVLRKQEEVVQESFMMIADCKKRLTTAHADLKSVLESEKDLADTAEYQNATQALDLALPHFE